MVDLCLVDNGLVFEWWSENRTEKSLFVVENVQYSNGPLSHVTLPFEYQTPKLLGIQITWYSGVRYSEGYSTMMCSLH